MGTPWHDDTHLPPAPSPEERLARRRDPGGRAGEPWVTEDPEWVRVTPLDHAGRRALWMRVTRGCVELRAGREASDFYAALAVGEVFTRERWIELYDLMLTLQYATETDLGRGPCAHCGTDDDG